jgi:prepilin peptidase CpaA
MMISILLLFLTLAAALLAIFYDLKYRRIPNFITIPSIICGVIIHTISGGITGFYSSISAMLIGVGIFIIFYILGGMGAGDVKFIGGVGALMGLKMMGPILIFTAFIGGVMSLYKIILFQLLKKFRKINYTEYNNKSHKYNYNQQINPMKTTIPYGVAIGLATLITIVVYD